jgi:hypothetical protein
MQVNFFLSITNSSTSGPLSSCARCKRKIGAVGHVREAV